MFEEHPIVHVHHDPKEDRLVLAIGDEASSNKRASRTVTLLLDGARQVVGVDWGGDPLGRLLWMAGPHESVKEQLDVTVDAALDATGKPVALTLVGISKLGFRPPRARGSS